MFLKLIAYICNRSMMSAADILKKRESFILCLENRQFSKVARVNTDVPANCIGTFRTDIIRRGLLFICYKVFGDTSKQNGWRFHAFSCAVI